MRFKKYLKSMLIISLSIVSGFSSSVVASLDYEDQMKYASVTKIEKLGALNWFEDVNSIFRRGDDALIVDTKTGKIFEVKRTFGTNHADVEPLTKQDTETIKNIWGGFSWEQRSVVVITKKSVMAASMAAMPHAGLDNKPAEVYISGRSEGYGYGANLDKVKNNGCDGVMDIHFAGSKGHASNSVSKEHQAMVKAAEKYILKSY